MDMFKESGDKQIDCSSTDYVIEGRGLNPLTWLLYVGFWFIQPFYEHNTRQWIYLAVTLLVFVLLYFGAVRGGLRTRRLCVLGVVALALVYVPINQSSFGIYFYVAWFLINLVETDTAVFQLMTLECVIICAQAWYFHLSSWEWSIGIGVTALSTMNAVRMRTQERANRKLRMAHDEIEQLAKTAERERIARDLHDLLGHTLSLIVIKSELASKLFTAQPERAAAELRDIEETARRALAEVRETVTGYRSRGLGDELIQAAQTLEAAGVRSHVPMTAPRLHAQHEATLALVLREAVTNVVRHAGATNCSVEIATSNAATRLVVTDDGRGRIEREGNGLRGMRERIVELGGSLTLNSDVGTRIEVALPALAH
jgi:two-component system sensor histidine kinase DesK